MTVGTGLFVRYGIYSQLQRGPNVQLEERIPLARYANLRDTFDPRGFDAGKIADVALAAGMRYVAMTARHADGFCLFRTLETDFNSLEHTGRDLVAELSEACRQRALGLFLAYSYAADWRHPYFYPPETTQLEGHRSRPTYEAPPPDYKFEKDEDFLHYIRYAHNQLQEIVYRYQPLAGIRLEPIEGYHGRPDLFPIEHTYSILRDAQPGLLIGFGQGVSGEEDFNSTEWEALSGGDPFPEQQPDAAKPLEIQYSLESDPKYRDGSAADDLLEAIQSAGARDANLLVSVPLLPDGSFAPQDERTLLDLGRLRPQFARG